MPKFEKIGGETEVEQVPVSLPVASEETSAPVDEVDASKASKTISKAIGEIKGMKETAYTKQAIAKLQAAQVMLRVG